MSKTPKPPTKDTKDPDDVGFYQKATPDLCPDYDPWIFKEGEWVFGRGTPPFYWSSVKEPVHGVFIIKGQSTPHRYMFQPSGGLDGRKEVQEMRRFFKLPEPNLLVQLSTHANPAEFMLWKENLEQIDDFKALSTITGETPEAHWLSANAVMYDRLVQILGDIASAASMTNSWLIKKGCSGSNDKLMAEAMDKFGGRPAFLDVVNLVNELGYIRKVEKMTITKAELPNLREQLKTTWIGVNANVRMQEFVTLKEPWGGVSEGWMIIGIKPDGYQGPWLEGDGREDDQAKAFRSVDKVLETLGPKGGTLRWIAKFGVPNEAKMLQITHMLFDKAKPLKVPFGEPLVVDLDIDNFYRSDADDEISANGIQNGLSMVGTAGVYSSWFNPAANFHIFTQTPQEFNNMALGPSGFIFIGGATQGGTKECIERALRLGRPSIFIDLTGGETQEYARLLRRISEIGRTMGARAGPQAFKEHVHELLAYAHQGQLERPTEEFEPLKVADVMRLIYRYCEQPKLFEETFIVVNPIQETSDQILDRFSQCFASVQASATEVGAGPADGTAVLSAWQLHMKMEQNSRSRRFWADVLAVLAMILTFLASSVAVVATYMEEVESEHADILQDWIGGKTFDYAVVFLPAVSGVVTAVLTQGNLMSKWATTFLAQNAVTSEIYRFRTREGNYSVTKAVAGPDDEDDTTDNISARMLESRTKFASILQKIAKRVTEGDMTSSYLSEDGPVTPEQLLLHINQSFGLSSRGVSKDSARESLTSASPSPSPSPRARSAADGETDDEQFPTSPDPSVASRTPLLEENTGSFLEGSAVMQAHIGVLSTGKYLKLRVFPLLSKCNQDAPRLWLKMQVTNFCGLVFAAMATVLAAVGMKCFVPLAVSATTVFSSVQNQFKFKQRLAATTSAVGELTALVVFWESLGPVAQRMESTKCRIVAGCEAVALNIATAAAGDLATLPTADVDSMEATGGKGSGMKELTKVSAGS
jgi:hypothetical protein